MNGLHIVQSGTAACEAVLKTLKKRQTESQGQITQRVADILRDIRAVGWEAVCRYSETFDGASPREIPKAEWTQAAQSCDPDLLRAFRKAAENIRAFHEKLLVSSVEWETDGLTLGVIVSPLARAGLYVPGGTAAYPSSVLMNAIPAKVAGVEELIMVTPPTEQLRPSVLAAAEIAGVDRVFALGGVQAVGALAYGVGPVPRVDKVVGPGNAYVAEAKRQLYGQIDIDMIAGPSELLIIADAAANPAFVAADFLSQAEHDVMASCVLLTTDEALAQNVLAEIEKQMETLSRRDIIERSLREYAAVIVCRDLEEVAELSNTLAPEHLEIQTENPRAVLPMIRHAGAVFLGAYTPEPLGDYLAGPSHVLPTTGTARFFSPLSVDTFLKKKSLIECSRDAFLKLGQDIERMAIEEKLTAHAASATVRSQRENGVKSK